MFALVSVANQQFSRTASPMDDRVSSPSCLPPPQQQSSDSASSQTPESNGQPAASTTAATDNVSKPYKPKFHNASLYAKEDATQPQHHQPAKVNAQTAPQLTVTLPLAAVTLQQPLPSTTLNGIASVMTTPTCGTPTSGIMHPLVCMRLLAPLNVRSNPHNVSLSLSSSPRRTSST